MRSSPTPRGFIPALLGATLLAFTAEAATPTQTQTFRLSAGWNLISFQVIPTNPEPAAVFSSLPGFQSAWAYDASTRLWQRHVQASGTTTEIANAQTANELLRLEPIQPGRGYWLQVENGVEVWAVTGTVPLGLDFPSLQFNPGWHLIGIPVGATVVSNLAPVSLLSVLSAAGFDYDAVLTWDTNVYRKLFRPKGDDTHPLAGMPADAPFPGFSLAQDLGRGYWVHALTNATLRPRLVTTVRPDRDLPPRGNFPSKEDENVSGATNLNGFRSVQTQDVIRFFPGEDVQSLGIANLGPEEAPSGGILLWEVVWTPITGLETPEPWIRLSLTRDEKEMRDAAGALIGDYTRLSGVTTIESDLVYLRLDRRHLGRGRHEGTLTVRTTVEDRAFRVIADIPAVEGDFTGYAVIQTVNGKRNPVPDLDLAVTFFEDPRVPGLLRGVIDSSRALLWPVDVPLIGHRVADEGNRFLLSGGFLLPPGDQNGEPFDQWDQADPTTAGRDVDWLNDGKLDVQNPFPFPIQRTVLLDGALVTANPAEGYVLKGQYREVLHGLSRTPIELVGTFHLERQNARPFTQRLSVDRDTGVEPVVVVRSAPSLSIPAGQTRTNELRVVTDLALRSLEVACDFDSGLAHSNLVISLRSPGPDGRELQLYDGSTPTTAISSNELKAVNFPRSRPPAGDLDRFIREIPRTGAAPAPGLAWQLVVENRGNQPATLSRWSLRLEGQPVTDVHGRVLGGDAPIAGATVTLSGLPFTLASNPTGNDGRFSLGRVPLLPLNFSATLPGYAPADPAQAGLSVSFTTPFATNAGIPFTALEQDLMKRFSPLAGAPPPLARVPGFTSGGTNTPFELRLATPPPGAPSLWAGPTEAFVGSTVSFAAIGATETVRWDFGDSSTADAPSGTHVFTAPGSYRVRLFTPAAATRPQATVDINVLAAPGNVPAGQVVQVFQASRFAGGVAHDVAPSASFGPDETNAFGAVLVGQMPLQHAYAASMDTDLAPSVNPAGKSQPFDSDGFKSLLEDPANHTAGFQQEDFNYELPTDAWKDTMTVNNNPEYPLRDEDDHAIVWGNGLATPKRNYASQVSTARDGQVFTVSAADDVYHPHSGTSRFDDLDPHSVVTHYRLACTLGAEILTASVPAHAVRPAKATRGDPDDPLTAPLLPASGTVARNLYFQLHLGLLSGD